MSASRWVGCALLLAGCRFDASFPAPVNITCSQDRHCPASHSCDLASGFCISLDRDVLAAAAVWPAALRPTQTLFVSLVLTREVDVTEGNPKVLLRLADGSERALVFEGQREGTLVYSTTVPEEARDGVAQVWLGLVQRDGAVLNRLFVGQTFVDGTAPRLGAITTRLVPAADNPLVLAGFDAVIDAATKGTRLRVEVGHEASQSLPVVLATPLGGAARALSAQPLTETQTAFEAVVDDTFTEGPVSLQVSLSDEVGNVTQRALVDQFLIDHTPPPAPDPAGQSLSFEYAPDGTLDAPGVPHAALRARRPVPNAWGLQVMAGTYPVLTVPLDATGALPATDLPVLSSTLSVLALDRAGNASPPARVLDLEYVALASGATTASRISLGALDGRAACPRPVVPVGLSEPVRASWLPRPTERLTDTFSWPARTALVWDAAAQLLVAHGFDPGSSGSGGYLRRSVWTGRGWRDLNSISDRFLPSTTQVDVVWFDPQAGTTALLAQQLSNVANVWGPPARRRQGSMLTNWTRSTCATPMLAANEFSNAPTGNLSVGRGVVGAFDLRRNRLVLFGGQFSFQTVAADDTLTLSATSNGSVVQLTNLHPTAGPTGRTGHALVYDPSRDVVVMAGGTASATGPLLADTWLYDGTTWRAAEPLPAPRTEAAGAWDPERRVVVLAGGRVGNVLQGDWWEFDGTRWSRRGEAPPLASAALAFHPLERRWLMAGGYALDAGVAVWSKRSLVSLLDGGWKQVEVETVDAGRREVVRMPTQYGALAPDDVSWAWDDDGGVGYAVSLAGTWFESGDCDPCGVVRVRQPTVHRFSEATAPLFEALPADGGPSGRERSTAVFWPTARSLLLVGGVDELDQPLAQTLRFDVASREWSTLSATVSPREAPALGWDPAREVMVLHGGVLDGGQLSDTFELTRDGGAWVFITTGPRSNAPLAWDPTRRALVMLGPDDGGLSVYAGGAWRSEAQAAPGFSGGALTFVEARGERISCNETRCLPEPSSIPFTASNLIGVQRPDMVWSATTEAVTPWKVGDGVPGVVLRLTPPVPAPLGLVARVRAGGVGGDGGVGGARLGVFSTFAFTDLDENTAPPSRPDVLEARSASPAEVQQALGSEGVVSLVVRSRAENGLGLAEVRVSDVEARWWLRLSDGGL